MRILHSSERAVVVHGDWRELELGTRTIDVTITDPPYTPHVHANSKSNNAEGQLDIKFEPLEDLEHVPMLLDITKRWVLCFAALEQLGEYKEAAGGWRSPKYKGCYVRSGIYKRIAPMPQITGDRPGQAGESIAIMHCRSSGKMHWNNHGQAGMWEDDRPFLCCTPNGQPAVFGIEGALGLLPKKDRAAAAHRLPGIGRIEHFGSMTITGLDATSVPNWWACKRASKDWKNHVAAKPEQLCKDLIEAFSNPGETIFDPYGGGGNIGVAALQLGRSAVIAEIEGEDAERIAKRVEAAL